MKYELEQHAAIHAVRTAARICQAIQRRLVTAETLQKKDKSPVTVADFASQAAVCGHLLQTFPSDIMIAEEDSAELREPSQAPLRSVIAEQLSTALKTPIPESTLLDWIDHGASALSTQHSALRTSPSPARFWTLDPIDGTKGFLRAEQYAVALALVEDGKIVLGVLGCPNLPIGGETGALLVGVRGQGTRILHLEGDETKGRPIHVSDISDPADARFCESVESGHSDHDQSAQIVRALGITTPPLRMDSQAKYATVARGDAQIYLRLPTRGDYQEKIWDHAAGLITVEEAGGTVTDITGKPLDFTHGPTLAANKGVVATNGKIHGQMIEAIAAT